MRKWKSITVWFFCPMLMKKQLYFCSPLESNLRTLISYCRPYFDVNATVEMLEEWRPLMCPFDVTMAKAMSYCEMFLPTFDSYSRKEQTFQLWFDELMAFWEACPNQPLFEPHLFGLFARMADHTRGEFYSTLWCYTTPFFAALLQPFLMQFETRFENHYKILNFDIFICFTLLIRKVKLFCTKIQRWQNFTIFLGESKLSTTKKCKSNPQHFHEFFTQNFFDNFSREIKVFNS